MLQAPVRRYVPFALAALLLILQAFGLFQSLRVRNSTEETPDMAVSWESRMGPIRDALPHGLGALGYIDDSFLRGAAREPDLGEYFLTQYALAPAVLRDGVKPEWIIGNFSGDFTESEVRSILLQRIGPHDLQNMGFGLYVVHRSGG